MNPLRTLFDVTAAWRREPAEPMRPVVLRLWLPAELDLEAAVRPVAAWPNLALRLDPASRVAAVTVPGAGLEAVVLAVADHIGPADARAIRARVDEVGVWDGQVAGGSLAALATGHRGRWLDRFIVEDRIATAFQPIVSAALPTRVFGHEALMRGHGRAGEVVMPAALLDAAREAGRLPVLDLHARLLALAAACDHGHGGKLFLNFSPQAVGEGRFHLDVTTARVDLLGLRRADVVFEITETDRITDVAAFAGVVAAYREAGFGVALDDIGSGYSSLRLLDQLRPDFVKIDMALVRDVHLDPFRAAITAKLLELARGLGVTAIAEGVEQVAEWRWLRDHGAELVQGHLFGRPASAPVRRDADACVVSFAVVPPPPRSHAAPSAQGAEQPAGGPTPDPR